MVEKERKYYPEFWKGLVLALLFWIPLVNLLFILPGSMYFSMRSILKEKKKSKKHGGMILSIIVFIWSAASFVTGLIIFFITSDNMIFNMIWSAASIAFTGYLGYCLRKAS